LHDKLLEMLGRKGITIGKSGQVIKGSKEDFESAILAAREFAYSDICFHQLANEPNLLTGIMRVLNTTDLYVHPRRFIRIGFPHDLAPSLTTARHQDYRYVQGAIDTLTAWIPLSPCEAHNGTLMLFPGTHKRGLLPVEEVANNSFSFVVSNDDLPRPVYAEVKAGDVVIFHSLTLHGAAENRSDRVRLSMDVRFQRANDPLCTSAFLAPYPAAGTDEDPKIWSKDPFYRSPVHAQLLSPQSHIDVKAPSTNSLFFGLNSQ
jgi:ectoine hydroxylase-related dioxygenase (phytanoyl-CoA dioxygenase family)